MALNLYTGAAGCGKTYRAINEFARIMKEKRTAFPVESSFFIVPEQFSVDIERKILETPGLSGFIGSEVISFNRLVHRIVSDSGIELGVKTSKSLTSMLLMSVLHKKNSELVYFKDCAGNPTCIDFLYNAITELKKNNVTPEFLNEISGKSEDDETRLKLHEFSLILKDYNEVLSDDNLFDSDTMTNFAIERIYEGKTELSKATVFVDSFVGFTYNEIRLLKAISAVANDVNIYLFDREDEESPIFSCPKKTILLIKKEFENEGQKVNLVNIDEKDISKTRFAKAPELYFLGENYGSFKNNVYDGENTDAIILAKCPDFYHEIETCADYINKLFDMGYKPGEIGVVASSLDDNHFVVSSVFSEKKIPCFVDMRSDMSSHPAILFVDSFLKIIGEDFKLEYVLKFLKTGLYKASYFSFETISKLENLLLQFNVDSQAKWKRFTARIDSKENKSLEEKLALDFYKTIISYKEKAISSKDSKVSYVLNEISCFMKDAEIENEIKLRAKNADRTFGMVWNSYVDIIKECKLALGDTEIFGYKKLHSYVRELLMAAVTGKEVAIIPPAGSYVQVGDMDRSRYIDKKVMMILGANEGSFPKPCPDTGFIGDEERALITENGGKISYNSTERSMLSQFNIYSALMSAREKLYISCSTVNEDGEEISKSNAFKRISRMFPKHIEAKYKIGNLKERTSTEEASDVEESLIREILEISDKYKTSISKIEDYENCPYSFFLKHILKLNERKTGKINSNDMGTLMHALFEQAVPMSEDNNGGNFDDTNLTNWSFYIKKAFDIYASDEKNSEDMYLFDNSEKNKFLLERALRFAANEGTKMCELSVNTGFKPKMFETTFGKEGSAIKSVAVSVLDFVAEFNGVVDRIDVREKDGKQEVSIVDYKSHTIDTKDVVDGIDLQLAMYYSAIKSGLSEELSKTLGEMAFVHSISYYRYGIDYDKDELHNFSSVINKDEVAEDKEEAFQKNTGKKSFASLSDIESKGKERITSSLSNMVTGKFPVNPVKIDKDKMQCTYCVYHDVCKFKK